MYALHCCVFCQVQAFLASLFKDPRLRRKRGVPLPGHSPSERDEGCVHLKIQNLCRLSSVCSVCFRHGRLQVAAVNQLGSRPTSLLDIKGVRPLAALELLAEKLQGCPAKRARWREDARVAAIMGSCPRSLNSLGAGATSSHMAYIGFCLDLCARHQTLAKIS